jgi:IS5 family transposase
VDKGYDNAEFIAECRDRRIAPHVSRNTARKGGSALDEATASTIWYTISQRLRKRIEEIFGWIKTVGGFRKTRFIGLEKTQSAGYLVGAAYNLLRIAKLLGAAA